MTPEPASAPDVAQDDHLDELERVAHDLLAKKWSATALRAVLDDRRPAFDADLWAQLVALGWTTILSDAEEASGLGEPELCVISEALGGALALMPVGVAAATTALTDHQPEQPEQPEWLVVLVDGAPATIADGMVSGSWASVPFGAVADAFVLLARDANGVSALVLVRASDVDRASLRPLDRSPDSNLSVSLPTSAITTLADGKDAEIRFGQACRAVLLSRTAELVGVAAAANAAAVDYAKERVAFGHPIGTFQAIKHRLVDQRAAVEVGRALVRRGARAARTDADDADELVALAAFWAVDQLRAVTEGVVQVFGGIGYTWENDAHLYLRRAACLSAALGSRGAHRDRAADWLVRQRSGR